MAKQRKHKTKEELRLSRNESARKYRKKNKDKIKEIDKRSKGKHREKINARMREYRKGLGKDKCKVLYKKNQIRIMNIYREYMSDKKCERCPCDDSRVLIWHHKDPKTKKMGVYQLVCRGYSWDTILVEIAKCECLCLNCHGTEHYSHNNPNPVAQKYKEFMKTKKCNRCPCNTAGTLAWHHIDPLTKEYNISSMVSCRKPWEEILEEISKCECLCRKCHHIEHNYKDDSNTIVTT